MPHEPARRRFLKTLAVASAGMALLPRTAHSEDPALKRPNLLFVFPDQMRAQAMGFMKQDPVLTPRLDRFTQEALVLPQAVSNYPVCSPFRGMLLSGRYSHSNKVLSNCTSESAPFNCELQEKDRCISDVLKDQGYSLGYVGKWHLEAPHEPWIDTSNNKGKLKWNEWTPPGRRHGFDFWYGYNTYDNHFAPEYWTTDAPRERRTKIDRWSPEHEGDMALKYLRNEGGTYRKADQPFALFVSMNPPHTPYQMVPKKYVEQYGEKTWKELLNRPNVPLNQETDVVKGAKAQIKNYFASVTGVDDQFGRLLDGLKELGLAENTIVVFTSDHGNCIGSHNHDTKNVYWEESMRIPFLIRWPGRIAARQDDLLLSVPDMMPTLLGLMGFEKQIPAEVEGTNHAAIFQGKDGPRPTSALYLIAPVGKPAQGRRGVRTHRYTMVLSHREGQPDKRELYDNVADPYQMKDLSAEKPEVIKELVEKELMPWLKKTKDPW
jgi:arylsulfatase A-like enzyme